MWPKVWREVTLFAVIDGEMYSIDYDNNVTRIDSTEKRYYRSIKRTWIITLLHGLFDDRQHSEE